MGKLVLSVGNIRIVGSRDSLEKFLSGMFQDELQHINVHAPISTWHQFRQCVGSEGLARKGSFHLPQELEPLIAQFERPFDHIPIDSCAYIVYCRLRAFHILTYRRWFYGIGI